MSIEGQGHLFTIYFPGFVCFVLYQAKISGEGLQDHWSSGFIVCTAVCHKTCKCLDVFWCHDVTSLSFYHIDIEHVFLHCFPY